MTRCRYRYALLIGIITALALAIVIRLFYLMVIQHDVYFNRSEKQIRKLIRIDTRRGRILDRNHHPLAMSLPVYSVYASPARIDNKLAFSRLVAPQLGMTQADILKKIDTNASFVWLKRKIPDLDVNWFMTARPNQMNVLREEQRMYPHHASMSDILGFVGMDGGLGGLEYQFDSFLQSEEGYYVIEGDPRGIRIISSDKHLIGKAKGFSKSYRGVEAHSLEGGDLITTIDYRVQFLVEQLLKDTIKQVDATAGQVIVMNVKNGHILAMANYPFFNPNNYASFDHSILKNSCIVDIFEPGSIFKLVSYAAALNDGVVTPNTPLQVPEYRIIQNRRIQEAHPRLPNDPDHYTAKDIIVQSFNVGTSLLTDMVGRDRFHNYLQAFGFGTPTQILLPGEASGLLRPADDISPIDLAVMSFGQGIGVTSLQMVAAIAAIGNNGLYVRPRMIKHQTDHHHITMTSPTWLKQHRVISSKTAAQVRQAMADVVTLGTGQSAKVDGYHVGGKTGTAQKPRTDGRGYDDGAYVASFVGLLPIDSPQYAILVMIDEPKTSIWGSRVAAPLFSDVAKVVIDFEDIPPKPPID